MGKFERKFGKYAIHNLSLYLITCYAFGYLMYFINSDFLYYLTLNPYWIMRGQVWRIITWILVPPDTSNIFIVLIMLYFYYSIGNTLERTWGTYRYNVYLFSGMLFTVIGSFALYLYMEFHYDFLLTKNLDIWRTNNQMELIKEYTSIFVLFSTYYINMSIFLAFAATFPNVQILLLFILPIKVKWLGIVYGAFILYDMIVGGQVYYFVIGASLLNFVIFFLTSRKKLHRSPKQIHRQHVYHAQATRPAGVTRHKCAICGRTEVDYPNLEFRFCTKCDGNYEYCQDHLFTHEHIHQQS